MWGCNSGWNQSRHGEWAGRTGMVIVGLALFPSKYSRWPGAITLWSYCRGEDLV